MFIEGARDPSAVGQVAQAIAGRYSLPVQVLEDHLRAGRFCVKSGVDWKKATNIARDLETMGAVCSIEDQAHQIIPKPTKPANSAGKQTMFGTGQMVAPAPDPAPPHLAQRAFAATIAVEPAPDTDQTTAPWEECQSGLAIATGRQSQQDLGALADNLGNISLAKLDGTDEIDNAPAPPSEIPTTANPFAPPGTGSDADLVANLAPIREARQTRDNIPYPPTTPSDITPPTRPTAEGSVTMPRQSLSPRGTAVASPPPAPEVSHPAISLPPPAPDQVSTTTPNIRASTSQASGFQSKLNPWVSRARNALCKDTRLRILAGVALALVVGFIPVQVISTVRERAAFAEIDHDLLSIYQGISSQAEWDDLEETLEQYRDLKRSRRLNIAVTSVLLWAGFAGGIGFVWFRKLNWDD